MTETYEETLDYAVRHYIYTKNLAFRLKLFNFPAPILKSAIKRMDNRHEILQERLKTQWNRLPSLEVLKRLIKSNRDNKESMERWEYQDDLATFSFYADVLYPNEALFTGDECALLADIAIGQVELWPSGDYHKEDETL